MKESTTQWRTEVEDQKRQQIQQHRHGMGTKNNRKKKSATAQQAAAREYEQLVQRVLEGLYLQQHQNVVVKHNVQLPCKARTSTGAAITRQVDVLAQFVGAEHQQDLVVQAKNWNHPISLPVIDSLSGMLISLEKPHRGMMVTSSYFQKGAILVAQQQGLELCVLRQSRAMDFSEGKIPTIDAQLHLMSTRTDDVQLMIKPSDLELFGELFKNAQNANPTEVKLYNEAGDEVGTMAELHQLAHKELEAEREYDEFREYRTKPRVFLRANDHLIEIIAFRGRFSRKEVYRKKLANTLTHTLAKLNSQEVFFLDTKGKISTAGEEFSESTEWIDMKKYFPDWFKEKTEQNEP
jgi:hypothetical protein